MKQKFHSLWFFFLLLAAFPFFMRLGMDSRAAGRQAVLEIYRDWRWSSGVRDLRKASDFILEDNNDKSALRDYFKAQLQQDFKVVEPNADNKQVPRVRAFFEEGSFVRARIELVREEGKKRDLWTGEARVVNNGILLTLWVLLLALLFGRSLKLSLGISAGVYLFWNAHWSLFQIPLQVWNVLKYFFQEMRWRNVSGDWAATEFGRLPELGVAIWFVLAFPFCAYFFKRLQVEKTVKGLLFFSFLLEPFALWTSGLFAHWSADTSWWKLYLGSLCFRFLSVGVALFAWMYPENLKNHWRSLELQRAKRSFTRWSMLAPPLLIFCGLWAWSNSVLSPSSSLVILRLKVFVVCFLIAFLLGSRVFSLWFGSLCLAVVLPPMTGHWNASALYGFLFDALLLGWFVSPVKGLSPVLLFNLNYTIVGPLLFMAWFLGVFLSSVGVPVLVSWVALVLAIWVLGQILENPRPVEETA